jgi:glycosyltransferase involved in cell wall biosynthesis
MARPTSKRLAMFICSFNCGGAQRVILNLLRAGTEAGIPMDLLLGKAEGPLLPEVPSEVRIIDFNATKLQHAIPKMALYLRRERPHAVVSHMTHGNLAFLLARILAGTKTPLAVVEQNQFSSSSAAKELRPRVQRLSRWLYPWADHVVGVSDGVSRDVEQSLGLAPGRVRTVYNPVVDAHLLRCAEQRCSHPWFGNHDRPLLVTAGRLEPQKDHATLLRAFAIVRRTRPARLVIFGEGTMRGELESLRRQLGLEADVDLPGITANPYAAMRQASLFVLSSRFEGLPTVLIEALACGCPTVSTTCPSGPEEILADGQYGVLTPMEDPAALAAGILEGLDRSWDRETLRQRGAEFSVQASLEQYLALVGYPPLLSPATRPVRLPACQSAA